MAKVNKVTTNGTTYELQDYDLNNSLSNISGIVKSSAGSLSEAIAGTDYDYPVLKGTSAPTTSTVGAVGQHYLNTSATEAPYEWVCVKVSGSVYTWVETGGGNSKHAETHAENGYDPITPEMIGAGKAYTYGTEDLTAGVTPLEAGKLHFVYE